MKTVSILILLLVPNWLKGQRFDNFYLSFSKVSDGYDTLFRPLDIFTINKSVAFTNAIHNNKSQKKIKWKFQRKGNIILISKKKEALKGTIINDSILTHKNIQDPTIDFILVPIASGLKLLNSRGQLIDKKTKSKIILTDFVDEDNLRKTQSLLGYGNPAIIRFSKTNFSISKEANLIYFGGFGKYNYAQLSKITYDSLLTFIFFNSELRVNDTIKLSKTLIKTDFPNTNFVNNIKDDLQGEWIMSDGILFNEDTVISKTSLTQCSYRFSFSQDKLILQRSFATVKIDTTSWLGMLPSENLLKVNLKDTLNYSINPTGDFIVATPKDKSARWIYIILKKSPNEIASFIFSDEWIVNGYRKFVDVLLKMKKI